MLTQFVSIEAKSGEKIVFDLIDRIEGYFQRLGVTARDHAQFLRLIQEFVSEDTGGILVEISEQWSPDFEGSDAEVRENVGDLDKVGVWYASGRAWFGPEFDD